jgi:pimeloyl-ACP methyl ester carboxylesterase
MIEKVPHSEPARVKSNGIEIVYDTFGEPNAPPLLLIMGLATQMIAWDNDFCKQLAAKGFWVIRFDNRDIGKSTKFDEAGVPDIITLMWKRISGYHVQAPYTLRDMVKDAIGLLDALEIERAHIVGMSMGGMIAQLITIHHPERVLTLTSMMSSTGDPELPPPRWDVMGILATPKPLERAAYMDHTLNTWRKVSGTGYPFPEARIRQLAERSFERGLSPGGKMRQQAAILASDSRTEALKTVTAPTLVIHGDADPLVPVECGIATADAIPGAKLMIVEGMGHELLSDVESRLIEAIASHAISQP